MRGMCRLVHFLSAGPAGFMVVKPGIIDIGGREDGGFNFGYLIIAVERVPRRLAELSVPQGTMKCIAMTLRNKRNMSSSANQGGTGYMNTLPQPLFCTNHFSKGTISSPFNLCPNISGFF